MNTASTLSKPLVQNVTDSDTISQISVKTDKILSIPTQSEMQLEGVRRAVATPLLPDLMNVFRDVLYSDSALNALSAKSKFNKNGFFKIRIVDSERFAIRLHIWMPGVYSNEHLHSHRWPLVSRVLKGQMTAEYWEDSLGDLGETLEEYHYKDGRTPLRHVGETKVQLGERITYSDDQSYFMTSDKLHRIAADGDTGCATLAVRFGNTRAWARNLMTETDSLDVSPGPCNAQDLERALSWLVGPA